MQGLYVAHQADNSPLDKASHLAILMLLQYSVDCYIRIYVYTHHCKLTLPLCKRPRTQLQALCTQTSTEHREVPGNDLHFPCA